VKITYDEYHKLAMMIIKIMKDFEREGQENVQQSQVIDRLAQQIDLGEM
jgi:hypothetical protein